jgi:hypothetical protein
VKKSVKGARIGRGVSGQPALSAASRAEAEVLARVALESVQDIAGRVRVEDYVTVLAALTGEAALVAAGVIDIETSGLTPGSHVFGDAINDILSGDTSDLTKQQPQSVIGILVGELVPATVPLALFVPLEELYRHVAATVGTTQWGTVATTVPADHKPTVLPLRVAFELRPAVDEAQAQAGLPSDLRHVPCALALCQGLKQVRDSADMGTAMRLALEVVFGMAKMVPMSRVAFEAVARAEQDA